MASRRNVSSRRGQMDLFISALWIRPEHTIDFLLSPKRDAHAAKCFFQQALRSASHPRPRVINVDGNPSYPKVIAELKRTGELGRRCRCRSRSLSEQHRGAGSPGDQTPGESESRLPVLYSAGRTIQGIETVNMIRKGQVRWLAKGAGQVAFVTGLFGLVTSAWTQKLIASRVCIFNFATLPSLTSQNGQLRQNSSDHRRRPPSAAASNGSECAGIRIRPRTHCAEVTRKCPSHAEPTWASGSERRG